MRFNSLSLCALRYFVRYNLTVAREPKESHEIMHRSTLRFQGNVDIGTSVAGIVKHGKKKKKNLLRRRKFEILGCLLRSNTKWYVKLMKWSSSIKGTERDPGGMDPVIYRTKEDISNGFNWISGFTLIKLSMVEKFRVINYNKIYFVSCYNNDICVNVFINFSKSWNIIGNFDTMSLEIYRSVYRVMLLTIQQYNGCIAERNNICYYSCIMGAIITPSLLSQRDNYITMLCCDVIPAARPITNVFYFRCITPPWHTHSFSRNSIISVITNPRTIRKIFPFIPSLPPEGCATRVIHTCLTIYGHIPLLERERERENSRSFLLRTHSYYYGHFLRLLSSIV